MQLFASSKKRGSVTLEQLSIPIQFARFEFAVFRAKRLQSRRAALEKAEIVILLFLFRLLDRLDDIPTLFLADTHLDALGDAQRLGQAQRD